MTSGTIIQGLRFKYNHHIKCRFSILIEVNLFCTVQDIEIFFGSAVITAYSFILLLWPYGVMYYTVHAYLYQSQAFDDWPHAIPIGCDSACDANEIITAAQSFGIIAVAALSRLKLEIP